MSEEFDGCPVLSPSLYKQCDLPRVQVPRVIHLHSFAQFP